MNSSPRPRPAPAPDIIVMKLPPRPSPVNFNNAIKCVQFQKPQMPPSCAPNAIDMAEMSVSQVQAMAIYWAFPARSLDGPRYSRSSSAGPQKEAPDNGHGESHAYFSNLRCLLCATSTALSPSRYYWSTYFMRPQKFADAAIPGLKKGKP